MPQFSQYIFNSLHTNPAYAGYKVDPFVQATYRSQFRGFPGAPNTFSVSADMGLLNESMGFGVSLMSDQLGPTKIQSAMLTYAYRIEVSKDGYLGLGISAGTSEYIFDAETLHPDDPTDISIPNGRINMFIPNLNTGIFFYNENFFAGISMFNLIGQNLLKNKDLALATHHYHYYFQLGSLFPISSEVAFKPSLLVREDFYSPTSYDINAMFLFYERIWLGAAYRSGIPKNREPAMANLNRRSAIVALLDVFVSDDLRFGYAYDMNLNKKSNYRNNSHEFSIGYYLDNKWANATNQRNF